MPEPDPQSYLPLREPTFFILLSLVQTEQHGYAILKDVQVISEGRVRLTTGTLYEALARLLDQGMIERVTRENGASPGKPRKYYRLTHLGRLVIQSEAARLAQLTAAAHQIL